MYVFPMIQLMANYVAVVDAGSFSEAGRRLDQPKSAISRRVAQLEEHLGVRLLQRSTRSVKPTEAGEEYYQRCQRILADVEDAERVVRQDQTAPTGRMRVLLPIELGMHVLGRLFVEFAREHPGISLQLELSSRVVDLIEHQVDLAVAIGALPDSSLIARRILSIKGGFYASPAFLADHGEPVSIEQLDPRACLRFQRGNDNGDWVAMEAGSGRKAALSPAGAATANNLTVLREAAVCGLGIVMLPHLICRDAVQAGLLRQVLHDWVPEDYEVHILYPSRQHLSVKVRSFMTFLDGRLGRLDDWINQPLRGLDPPD
jgi:DNA-binding transcriptional LysR family regulator